MSEKTSRADVEAARKAQEELCAKEGLPHFAPRSGECWSCGKQIYEELDGQSLVTGCPSCHRSYCD